MQYTLVESILAWLKLSIVQQLTILEDIQTPKLIIAVRSSPNLIYAVQIICFHYWKLDYGKHGESGTHLYC